MVEQCTIVVLLLSDMNSCPTAGMGVEAHKPLALLFIYFIYLFTYFCVRSDDAAKCELLGGGMGSLKDISLRAPKRLETTLTSGIP